MRIINIIVTDNETPVVSIDSFAIIDENCSDEVVELAEEAYQNKALELKFGEGTNTTRDDLRERDFYREEVSETLEDGWIQIGEHTVSFVWSYCDNVQF